MTNLSDAFTADLDSTTDVDITPSPTVLSATSQLTDLITDDLINNDDMPTDFPELVTTPMPIVGPIELVIIQYAVTGILLLLAFCGVLGNSLVIICVLVNKKLRFVTYWALVSLSLSDILFGIAAIPLDMASKLTRSLFWCRVTYILINALHIISVVNMLLIGIWRLVIVRSPTAPNLKKTGRIMKAVLLLLWLYAIGIGFLSQLAWKKEYAVLTSNCIFEMITDDWYLVVTKTHPLLCTISLVGIYTSIVVILRRRRETVSSNSANANWKRRENKLTRAMFIVFINFFCCYSFYYFVYARILLDPERFVPEEWVQGFVAFGVTLNGVMNPFIYMANIPEFKVAVTQVRASLSRSSASTTFTGTTKVGNSGSK